MHDGVGLEPDEQHDVEETQQQEHGPVAAQVGVPAHTGGQRSPSPPRRSGSQPGEEDRRRVVQAHLDYGEGRSQKRTSKAKASTTKRRLPKIRKISF